MQYNQDKFQLLQLASPQLLFWAINPVMAINELILGQRLPQVILIEKHSTQPMLERQFIPCPHCKALNPARLWSSGNAFAHWFGYVCPECSGTIPCLWNVTSLLLLALTAPIWLLLKKPLQQRCKIKSLKRVIAMKQKTAKVTHQQPCIKTAQATAVILFLFMSFIQSRAATLSVEQMSISLMTSCLVGIVFGQLATLKKRQRSKKRY